MSTKRKHKPKNYRLTKYIKVLGKQNAWNSYAACLACSENLEEGELLKVTFTNKKLQVKNHLKSCVYFQEKVGGQEEVDAIINLTDNENEEIARQKRLRIDDSDSGKMREEKVLKYLKSMQSNLILYFLNQQKEKQLQIDLLPQHQQHHLNATFIQLKLVITLWEIFLSGLLQKKNNLYLNVFY